MEKSKVIFFVVFGLFCGVWFSNVSTQNLKKIFSCQGRPSGYYADIQSGCQIYHMCDGLGRQFSYSCPNTTLFQQRMLICDHWYMVNCSKSEVDYGANLLIGQREKPFVEDDAENPYHRTPRPDLLAHPSGAEYNIIYRIGRAQQQNTKNLVGAESDYDDDNLNQPAYFLPSHWSTNYQKDNEKNNEKNYERSYEKAAKKIIKNPVVNFKSSFKATTPVYPKIAPTEIPLFENNHPENMIPVVLQPPALSPALRVNFESKFKATTPVYPTYVTPEEPLAILEDSEDKISVSNSHSAYGLRRIIEPPKVNARVKTAAVINFESKFKATTPVYPKFVTAEAPLAVQDYNIDPNHPSLSTVIQPPKSYQINTVVQEPSAYYQPPVAPIPPVQRNKSGKISIVPKSTDWKQLRTMFLIPDYDFPLDVSAIRPNYNDGPDSFQVNPFSYEITQRQHA